MLAIARALMAQPDGCCSSTSRRSGSRRSWCRRSSAIIREINARGTTILLVEQNAHMALRRAHRGYVLETGAIAIADTATNLLASDRVKKAYLGG